MEPIVKKKSFICSALKAGWSFLLPIPGLMEEKEACTLNLTKEQSSKGEDPRPSQDSQARGSPAGFIPGKGSQRRPVGVYLLLILTPWYLLCSARGFPKSSCFPGPSILSQKGHRKANLHWVLPMCQELHQVSKAPPVQGSQRWGLAFYSANAPKVLCSSGPLHVLSEVPTLCKSGSFFLFLQLSSPRPPHPTSLTPTHWNKCCSLMHHPVLFLHVTL